MLGRRGRLRPQLEAGGLLRDPSGNDALRRPADVLLCSSSCLRASLPDGARMPGSQRVALDFAVINALGSSHWQTSCREIGGAAAAYAQKKRRHLDTAAHCQAEGISFQPVVFTSQGTMTKEASSILRGIAEAISVAEGGCPAQLCEEIFERVAILIARANSRAVTRRQQPRDAGVSAASAALAAHAVLSEPMDVC